MKKAIMEDSANRKLKYPVVFVYNKTLMYLKHPGFVVIPNSISPKSNKIDLKASLNNLYDKCDGVYCVLDYADTPPKKLDYLDKRKSELIFWTKAQKKCIAVYFIDVGNVGTVAANGERGEPMPNGDFADLSPIATSQTEQLIKRGFMIQNSNSWPKHWRVNPHHYWHKAPNPGDGLSIINDADKNWLSLQCNGQITVFNTTSFDIPQYKGISFTARSKDSGVFLLYLYYQKNNKFILSRSFVATKSESHYKLIWDDDFRTKPVSGQYVVGIEMRNGHAEFRNFSLLK